MRTVTFVNKEPPKIDDFRGVKRSGKIELNYTVELITPMFGGGVKPGEIDKGMPFRIKSLRGQLRFWWRFLASRGAFGGFTDSRSLFNREIEIWGGVTGKGAKASKVTLMLVPIPLPANCVRPYESFAKFPNKQKEEKSGWLVDQEIAPGIEPDERRNDFSRYVLFPAQRESGSSPKKLLIVARPTPAAKLSVTIDVGKSDPNIRPQVEQAILWWATLGGLGARSRRGAGSVRVSHDGNYLSLVDEMNISKKTAEWNGARCFWRDPMDNSIDAWREAIRRLYDFRQGKDGRNGKFGRSKWPEPDFVRTIQKTHFVCSTNPKHTHAPNHVYCKSPRLRAPAFIRAAFGMPLAIKFKKEDVEGKWDKSIKTIVPPKKPDPSQNDILPEEKKVNGKSVNINRMASPLILRAIATKSGKFVPAVFCFPLTDDFWAQRVKIDKSGKTYPIWDDALRSDMKAKNAFNPLNLNLSQKDGVPSAENPIDAFINYFLK